MSFYDIKEATVADLVSQKKIENKKESAKYFRLFLRSYSVLVCCLSVEY